MSVNCYFPRFAQIGGLRPPTPPEYLKKKSGIFLCYAKRVSISSWYGTGWRADDREEKRGPPVFTGRLASFPYFVPHQPN